MKLLASTIVLSTIFCSTAFLAAQEPEDGTADRAQIITNYDTNQMKETVSPAEISLPEMKIVMEKPAAKRQNLIHKERGEERAAANNSLDFPSSTRYKPSLPDHRVKSPSLNQNIQGKTNKTKTNTEHLIYDIQM
jgi:hypothetical protein